ncbi:CopY family transcriptional regulator [Clostridium thermosuccinogenes]|jgi:predicted transcriptional regulator|uniref:CopY family transcriptional regulator n=1 Tax=Clostridium thermosuccinogenes TaxID=84032 RepID=A0A2K2FNF4_9CLOT|nr:BlaI/MecI/CopY family transcriptional regulator [Pseudoclostridium thermosuccinogenes]AUS98009.1 CopY family transcriptional regulator [Pseudoclostridium thermosuccinogenes]PNT94300.1 CopY family transcriptional regulator [Pseudoclostridium thermosuccinogenes]PNU00307.1 CopY family transcriptional regulator [Pseudoclostridium thermosuccinogenes]PNU01631.1 CopY family transcriptional regulator [Pseudoclostridium thermosuccinogenes]
MNKKIKRLPDSELDIMLVIWEAGKPVSRAYIDERLREKKNLAVTTVLTFLSRLIEKGFVTCERQGKMNIYSAAIKEEDYLASESKYFLEKLYRGSLKTFVATLYNNNDINDDEISELQEFLDKAREGRKND